MTTITNLVLLFFFFLQTTPKKTIKIQYTSRSSSVLFASYKKTHTRRVAIEKCGEYTHWYIMVLRV